MPEKNSIIFSVFHSTLFYKGVFTHERKGNHRRDRHRFRRYQRLRRRALRSRGPQRGPNQAGAWRRGPQRGGGRGAAGRRRAVRFQRGRRYARSRRRQPAEPFQNRHALRALRAVGGHGPVDGHQRRGWPPGRRDFADAGRETHRADHRRARRRDRARSGSYRAGNRSQRTDQPPRARPCVDVRQAGLCASGQHGGAPAERRASQKKFRASSATISKRAACSIWKRPARTRRICSGSSGAA